MLNCKIIFKDQEYTIEEFKAFVLENGIGSLLGDSPSQLALNIVSKLDYRNQDESLSELWARLRMEQRGEKVDRYLTQKEIDQELNPSGQLTDYATQREIRYNTYSGIALTGISANFGKTLGYLFEASPITSVYDTLDQTYIDVSTPEAMKAFVSSQNAYTIEAVLQKSNRYKAADRKTPTLKDGYTFTVDGVDIDGFSRTTRKFKDNTKTPNIFETIDTIINLAIDNVKEQKLHLLGITNANANAYLTMVGMGIPLNIVSRIFKTPIIDALNNSGKRFSEAILQEEIDRIIEKMGQEPKVPAAISSQMLDQIFTGKASEADKDMHDLAVLKVLQRVVPIGNEMFDYAKTFSVLRGIPNKKWQIDDIISTIEKYSKFSDEKNFDKRVNDEFKESVTNIFKRESPEYKKLIADGKDVEAQEMLEQTVSAALDDKSIFGSARAEIRAGFVNRVLRHTNNRKLEARSASVFNDTIVLRIPHVMSAYRTLLQTQTILNKSFAVYNKVVTDFVKGIIKEANIFTEFESSVNVELISKELVKFLSSNLEFEIDGVEMSTKVAEDTTFSTSTRNFAGKEAWAQKFISNFAKVRDSAEDMVNNEFIKALEFDTDVNGLKTVKIVGDKVNDEEVLEGIKEDFVKFAQDNSEITPGYTRKQAARDLFKYALLSSSMYYERTGFALVFPANWVVSYSASLDNRLQTVIPNGKAFTDINLSVLKDKFLIQLLANNDKLLARTKVRPIVTKTQKKGAATERSYSGIDMVDNKPIYFDLKYPISYGPESRKLTTHFDGGVYAVIPTPNSTSTYYAKIADKPKHRFYDFDPSNIEESIDITALTKGYAPLIHKGDVQNNRLTLPKIHEKYAADSRIIVFDRLNPAVQKAEVYRIKSVSDIGDSTVYSLQHVEDLSITKREAAAEKRKYLSMFIEDRLAPTTVVSNVRDVMLATKPGSGIVFLVNNTEFAPGAKQLALPNLSPDITIDQQNAVASSIIQQIENFDRSVPYYVSDKILEPLDAFPVLRAKVSEALVKKIGFRDPKQDSEVEVVNEIGKNVEMELKRLSLIKFNLENKHKVQFSEEGPQTHFLKLESNMKYLTPGDLIWAGKDTYFYVNEITTDKLLLTEFKEPVFYLMEQNNYSLEEFENIYRKTINC